MANHKILWADDEIELLKPHLLFLESKGYEVKPVNSGMDALDEVDAVTYDLVFLDEHMPGMSGLEVLSKIKSTQPHLPVVMITKNEEEHIMEEAIGSKIADYLIKPINPNQVLLSIKKILDNQRIITEKTNLSYQQQFGGITMELQDNLDHQGWADVYKKLIYWDLQIDQTEDKSMSEVLSTQLMDANHQFCDFIQSEYPDWISSSIDDRPLLSHEVVRERVFPLIGGKAEPVVMIVIDNLRYDQWETLEPEILKLYTVTEKESYYSILPTTTAYARNALFAGKMPLDIAKQHPELWVGEDSDEGKNNKEGELLGNNLDSLGYTGSYGYYKILNEKQGKELVEQVPSMMERPFNAVVFNFVDMLSHARTDMQMIRQLAPDESAYRELTKTWFNHSSLLDFMKALTQFECRVVITTDHGTVRVKRAEKIVGDRDTNTNLRYKQGKRLSFDRKKVFEVENPESIRLPQPNLSTSFAFALEDRFFAYPNNFNYYANHYRDTFQHGGVSLEEMILPLILLQPK
jgi:CheY-like chemotaxis protein